MSEPLSLQMSRTRAMAVAGCFVAGGLLLFVAGTVSGLLMASASGKPLPAKVQPAITNPQVEPKPKPVAPEPAAAPNPAPATADEAAAEPIPSNVPTLMAVPSAPPPGAQEQQTPAAVSSSSQLAVAASSSGAPPATPGTAANASKAIPVGAPAGITQVGAQPGTEPTYAIPLAIRVCSFTGKASAENLIAALATKGYRASIGHSLDAHGRTWYVVELGPYTEWNKASSVAAHIAIAENVRPVIGPAR